MMKVATKMVVGLALVLGSVGAAGAGEMHEVSFTSGDAERTYSFTAPSDLEPSGEPVPLLIVFHGSGRDGASIVGPWRKLAEKEGFLVAGPKSTHDRFWRPGDDGPDMLRDLVEHVAERWPVDRRRVYLFGHSAGGGFTLQMGLLESRYFAAAALHAGVLAPGTESWLPEKATRPIPFHMVVGTEDRFVPLSAARATRDVLAEAGLPVELVELAGHGHDYYGKSRKLNRQAWQFLSAHRLAEEPVYEPRAFY